jgi:GntR family transcriptional regulator
MALLQIDPASPVPPFEQVRTQVAAMAANGELTPGQKLPTVRQLAADLGLAANTVARAYRELEADNIISTHGRQGTFIRSAVLDSPHATDEARSVQAAAARFTSTARKNGLSLAEATRLIETAWPRASS